MSRGRKAPPEIEFSTAGISTRSRSSSLRDMIMCASAKRGGRAAHVLLHIEHGGIGLDVEPAGIEANALADQRDARMIRFAPVRVDQPRRAARRRGRPRESSGKFSFNRSSPTIALTSAPCLRGERARGFFELGRSHVVRRRVDEVARQRHRFDDALKIFAIDALRQIELDRRGLPTCGSG